MQPIKNLPLIKVVKRLVQMLKVPNIVHRKNSHLVVAKQLLFTSEIIYHLLVLMVY